jgi:acyl transferase domain-containing protein
VIPKSHRHHEQPEGVTVKPHERDKVASVPWVLSAYTENALQAQARLLARHINARSEMSIRDVGLSLATTRATLPYRGVAVGDRREQLVEALQALSEGRSVPGLVRGKADLVS